jgi:protein involved in polysaccharide export with SLBB domain
LISEQIQYRKAYWPYNPAFKSIVMLVIFLILLMAGTVFSQQEEKTDLPLSYMNLGIKQPENVVPLDRPIDPLVYRLGPGDKLSIFIWGNVQAQYNLVVTPEGKILIPMVGPVDVSGLILADAKIKIKDKILQRIQNVEVTTDLVDLRVFRVSVGGAVKYPGIYNANGVTRVSEVIAMAGGFEGNGNAPSRSTENSIPVVLPVGAASHRDIIVKHTSGKIDTADVLVFEQAGELKYNFKLNDGDEIFVPLKEKKINMYGIFGGVKNPAYFEYSPRDSLKDLINLANGLTLDVDSSRVELVRFSLDGKSITRTPVDLKGIIAGEIPDIKMMPDDRVFIKTRNNYNEKNQVLVLGEVKYPGFYAIDPDSTYLSQVLAKTGGFTPLASLAEAEMTRFSDREVADREFKRLQLMNVSDMSDLEYEYFKVKSREKPGRVAVNFQELYNHNNDSDIKLKNGDIINIPRVSEVVNVSGEIANPGLLAYNPDYKYMDYIKLAGGFSFRANKGRIRIIKGTTGEWKKANAKTSLRPGDTILVPEKKKRNYFSSLKDIMAFSANAATVYLVIREATK